LVVTTYTIHLPQDSYSSKSEQGLNIGPTHSPGRREAAELSTEILDQFLEFITRKTIRPKKPIGDTVTTASYAIYKETLADNELSEEYEHQLKDLIETKFPNGLTYTNTSKDSTTKNCDYYMLARTQGRLKQEHLKLQSWTIGGQVWSTTCQM
jgi:hypothetical protein